MKKHNIQSPPAEVFLTLLALAASTSAQSTVSSDSANSDVVTSFYSVCPTAISTTITLPMTITYCPGPNCNGGAPAVTQAPVGPGIGGVHLGEYTSIGPDGKTTIMGLYETILDHLGPSGIVPATYTLTEPCPCQETLPATSMPSGFQTTIVPCHVCAATGGPATITLTQPCPTGPYASQTPVIGQPSTAVAAPSSGSGSGSGSWSGPVSGSGSSNAGPSSGSGSGSGFGSDSGSGSNSGMSQCVGATCTTGIASPSSGMTSNSTSGGITPPIQHATGGAHRSTVVSLTLLASLFIKFMWML